MSSDTVPYIIKRGLPNAVVYDLTAPGCVTITLPAQSTWSSGLHWHESHDEYLQVVKGSIRVVLGGETLTVTAADNDQPEIKVPKYAWHSWQRAEPDGGEAVVVERTEPADLQKSVFFWNLNGVILNAPEVDKRLARLPSRVRAVAVDFWVTMSLFVIFHRLDNYPVFFDEPRFLQRMRSSLGINWSFNVILRGLNWLITHSTLLLAAWVGWIPGAAPVQRRFTPAPVFAQWQQQRKPTKVD